MDDPKEGLQAVLFFGLISILISFYAWRKGYFRLPKLPDPPFMRFLYVFVGFLFYLILFFFLSPLLGEVLKNWIPIQKDQVVSYISWINFSTLSVSTLFILLFYGLCFPDALQKIMKRSSHPIRKDILLGLATLAISFPIVLLCGELWDIFIYLVFRAKEVPEQLAIQYLQMTLHSPFFFLIALFSIIILAPFVEEFMFRGLLQNFLREKLGIKSAIFVTALLFSFFHYSPSQGLGNISIVGSLFVLACFLGFIYERQRSLFASITLHSAFNLINIVNLLLSLSD